MSEEMATQRLWVLIEGPGLGDAEFLGRWLLAAVEADRVLMDQFRTNPTLKQQISRIEIAYVFSFSPAATKCVELLMKNLTCFSLSMFDERGEVLP
jgi:hypothetical protein